ncbi:MAG: MFS transporter [Candidatus Bathyarchaeia archaeon]
MTTSENIPLEARILTAMLPIVPAPPKTVTLIIPPALSQVIVNLRLFSIYGRREETAKHINMKNANMTSMDKTHAPSYRWIVLLSYMIVAVVSQILWLNFAPITKPIMTSIFGVTESDVGLLSMVWPLLFIPVSIPAGILIDKKGFKFGVSIGASIMALFAVLRVFSGKDFTLLLIFQSCAALGQPFVFNAITKLVTLWFPFEERALATGIGIMGQYIGMIIALILTPFLVPNAEITLLTNMLIIYAAISVAGAVLFIALAKEKPRIVSAEASEVKASISFNEVKKFFGKKDFIILEALFFIGVGLFTALLTWLETILNTRGLAVTEAGLVGGIIIIGGIFGSLIIPGISDKTARRKPFIIVDLAVAAAALFLLAEVTDFSILAVVGFVLGFFLMSALPIGLEMSAEIVGSALAGSASSFLWLFSQAGSVVFILFMDAVRTATQSLYPTNPYYLSVISILIFNIIALLLCIALKETAKTQT